MTVALIIAARRTPAGAVKVGKGALTDRRPQHLGARHPQTHQRSCADAIASASATMQGVRRADLEGAGAGLPKARRRGDGSRLFWQALVAGLPADCTLALGHEECPRPQTTAERLVSLKPAFSTLPDVALNERGATDRSLILAK